MEEKGKKEKTDKIINGAAAIAAIAFFAGIFLAIWVGMIGVKIAVSAAVVLAAEYTAYFWPQKNREERKKRGWERE